MRREGSDPPTLKLRRTMEVKKMKMKKMYHKEVGSTKREARSEKNEK